MNEHPPEPASPPSDADAASGSVIQKRIRYTREELLSMRTSSQPAPAYLEYLRASLGPVAKGEGGRRWTSKLGPDRADPAHTRSAPVSAASSPPSKRDDRLIRGEGVAAQEVPQGRRSVDNGESARTSTDRDISRIFPSANGSFAAKPMRSPPSKRAEAAGRLSVKTDGNGIMMHGAREERPRDGLARSPRESEFHGIPERRRSPSPRKSPRSSPKVSPEPSPRPGPGPSGSPSFPPGFGPPQSKSSTNPSLRNQNNGKTRICRGPNLKENFATRIAYQQKKLSFLHPTAPTNPQHSVPGNAVGGAEHVRISVLPKPQEAGSKDSAHSRNTAQGNLESGVPGLPTMSYNITDEFDDFAKRLADATASHAVVETSPEQELADYFSTGIKDDALPDSVFVESDRTQKNEASRAEPKQDEVDALTKWLARISDAPPEEDLQGGNGTPVPSVEEPKAEAPFRNAQESRDGLDSTVLSFFDSIRSEALTEGTQPGIDTPPIKTSLPEEEGKRTVEMASTVRHNEAPHGESSDQAENTEVERFFQLFTEGKPVYDSSRKETTDSAVENRESVTHANGSSSQLAGEQSESDMGGLERWFQQLASGPQE